MYKSLLIAANVIRLNTRNKKEFVAFMVLPLVAVGIMMFMFGIMFSKRTVVNVVNCDNGALGNAVVTTLQQRDEIVVQAIDKPSACEGNAARTVGGTTVIIPHDFTSSIVTGKESGVTLYGDSSSAEVENIRQSMNASISSLYVVAGAIDKLEPAASAARDRESRIVEIVEQIQNSKLSVNYRTPVQSSLDAQMVMQSMGFAIMFVMTFVFNVIGNILEDKRNQTLARIYAAPVKQWEIAAGNILGSFALGLLQTVALITTIMLAFRLDWSTQFPGLFLILTSFVLATIGMGFGIASLLKGEFNYMLIISTFIAPSCLLGGCFIPREVMPGVFEQIGYFVPQSWAMEAIRFLVNNPGISPTLVVNSAVILAFGLVFAALGVKMLKPLP